MSTNVIDLSLWTPDKTYAEGLKLCVELELIEMIIHGHEEYGRPTQKGINVMVTMMEFAQNAADPNNYLKKS